jgi:nicotinamide mononucleotide transporter
MAANLFATVSIFFAGRNHVNTWWTGVVGCFLFIFVFMNTQLYADAILQIFFIITSFLGWWRWLRGDHGRALEINNAKASTLVLCLIIGLATALLYGGLLKRYTHAYAPYLDSIILVFSVIAQLLLMQRRIQTWPFWLLVNTIAVPLYASRGLYLTAGLYTAYWINAVVSWRHWRCLLNSTDIHTDSTEYA